MTALGVQEIYNAAQQRICSAWSK